MSNIAIIPARGGSKRIPKKNIRNFCGKPMISYPIETAKRSALFDRIVVSTDSEEIAEIAKAYGAEIPFKRPRSLADDYSTTGQVVLHAVKELQKQGAFFDVVFCIYATTPFLRVQDLKKGHLFITECHAPSAYTVTSFSSCIYRALQINEDGQLQMIWPENQLIRSQDFPAAYHDAGQYYCAQTKHFLAKATFGMQGARPIILPRYLAQDIDTEEDWIIAEQSFNLEVNNSDTKSGDCHV